MRSQWLAAAMLTMVLMTGCAAIPTGGYYGDVSDVGTPGPVLGTMELGEGMLVETKRAEIEATR